VQELSALHSPAQRPMANQRYKAAEVVEALESAEGVVTSAAERLGCSARTVYRYAGRYSTVDEAMRSARATTYAEAHSRLLDLMHDPTHKDHRWAVEQVLKIYGPGIADGLDWSERQRLEHQSEDDLTIRVIREPISD